MCYFEVEREHIVAGVPLRWWKSFSLEKTGDQFIVRKDKRWYCFFPQKMCKLKKCHVDCQKFFWVNWHLEVGGGKDFWSKHDGRESFSFRLDFMVWIIFNHEGIIGASETCIRHYNQLFPSSGLFQCELALIIQRIVYSIKRFLQFRCDIDWDFCFQVFVKWIELLSHPEIKIYEPQIAPQSLLWFGESQFVQEVSNFVSLWWYPLGWKSFA